MKDELEDQLLRKYPRIFRDRYAPITRSLMAFGLEVGDGWYNIIEVLCSQIQGHITWQRNSRARVLRYNRALDRGLRGDLRGLRHHYSSGGWSEPYVSNKVEEALQKAEFREVPDAAPQVIAQQVKEKFAGLRFYCYGGDEHTRGLVAMAEAMSYRTCEVCGAPGRVYHDGWHTTLCETHAREQGRGQNEDGDGDEE